jgi:predicted transposase YdaD
MILAGIRGLEQTVETEARHMPILNDIMDHRVIGPAIRQGLEQGRREGAEQGRREEALAIIRRQITKRFGQLSVTFEERLGKLSASELEDLGERFVDATSLTDLFETS